MVPILKNIINQFRVEDFFFFFKDERNNMIQCNAVILETREREECLTKEQMSSHQPQISGKTPISTTTSKDTCNCRSFSVTPFCNYIKT